MTGIRAVRAPERRAAAPAVPVTGGTSRWPLRVLGHLGGSALVLLAILALTFFALKLIPGDPVIAILGGSGAAPSDETIAAVRAEYGLDQPVIVQFAAYLVGLLQGDLGLSWLQRAPVADYLLPQLGPTLQLTAAAIAVAWALALVLALFTVRRGRIADAVGRAVEVVFAALPPFWIALVLLVVFSFTLGWFPASGSDPRAIVLPAVALAIPLAGFLAQVTREALDEALAQPFVLSARARGAGEWRVRLGHALRHASLPALNLSGWAVGSLISGAVVAEVIFARQGLGRSLVDAIAGRDAPVVLAVVLFIGLVYILVNLAVDVLARFVDPRLGRRATA